MSGDPDPPPPPAGPTHIATDDELVEQLVGRLPTQQQRGHRRMTQTEYDGRAVIGATTRLVGAGDGLSQSIKLKGELPDYHLGDRAMLVHNAELIKVALEPAVKDDLAGDLMLVMTWRALDGLITDAPAVKKLLDAHAKRLQEAKELAGQQTLLEEENRLAAEEAGEDDWETA